MKNFVEFVSSIVTRPSGVSPVPCQTFPTPFDFDAGAAVSSANGCRTSTTPICGAVCCSSWGAHPILASSC